MAPIQPMRIARLAAGFLPAHGTQNMSSSVNPIMPLGEGASEPGFGSGVHESYANRCRGCWCPGVTRKWVVAQPEVTLDSPKPEH